MSIFPYYWMVITALSEREWIQSPTAFPIPPYLDSLRNVLFNYPFLRWALNTSIVSIAGTSGALLFASFAAFSFACLRWKYRDLIFYILLSTLFLPGFVMIIPKFFLMVKIGWMNTYWGIFVPSWFSIFSVFLLRQHYFTIPHATLNAARVDGANLWQIYWKLAVPHAKMVLMALFVINFIGQWNDFFWPLLIIKSNDMQTLAVGMADLGGCFTIAYNDIMASAIFSLIPTFIIFAFLSKYITKGLKMRINF